jgi:hypothetical protein
MQVLQKSSKQAKLRLKSSQSPFISSKKVAITALESLFFLLVNKKILLIKTMATIIQIKLNLSVIAYLT